MLAELKLLVTSVCVKCRCFCLRLNCRIHFLFMIVAVLAAFYFVQALFAPSLSLQTDSTDVNFCALAFHNSHTSPLCISRMSYTYLQHSKVKWKNLHHIFAVVSVFVHRLSQSHPLCCGKIKCYASCIRTCWFFLDICNAITHTQHILKESSLLMRISLPFTMVLNERLHQFVPLQILIHIRLVHLFFHANFMQFNPDWIRKTTTKLCTNISREKKVEKWTIIITYCRQTSFLTNSTSMEGIMH